MKLQRALLVALTATWVFIVCWIVGRTQPLDAKPLTICITLIVSFLLSAFVFVKPSWSNLVARAVGIVCGSVALHHASNYIHSGACDGDGLCPTAIFDGLTWDVRGAVVTFVIFAGLRMGRKRLARQR